MRLLNKLAVSIVALTFVSAVFHTGCLAQDDSMLTQREIRRANAANRVSPKVTAMHRADTLSMEYYQAKVAERAELKQRLKSQPHPRLFTKVGLVNQQLRKDCETARNYPVEWFCYIKGNGVAVWDHRP